MNKFWLILVAVWKILVWWSKKDAETQAKRKELKEELNNAVKTGDTRELHRVMSRM